MSERRNEEKRLFLEYRSSGERAAREALVERFLPLARSLARRYARGREPLEDLEQVASLALLRAVDRFDPDHDTAFSSYAVPSIVGALKRHYGDLGWSVRPPRELELALHINHLNDELNTAGVPPTPAQIADYAGVTVEEVLEAREAYRALQSDSLDQARRTGDDDDSGSLIDTLGSRDGEIRRAFDRVALEGLLVTLEDRDRLIVQLYYLDELTQREIGQRLGYSQMHISRLLRAAVERLLIAAAQQPDQVTRSAA